MKAFALAVIAMPARASASKIINTLMNAEAFAGSVPKGPQKPLVRLFLLIYTAKCLLGCYGKFLLLVSNNLEYKLYPSLLIKCYIIYHFIFPTQLGCISDTNGEWEVLLTYRSDFLRYWVLLVWDKQMNFINAIRLWRANFAWNTSFFGHNSENIG